MEERQKSAQAASGRPPVNFEAVFQASPNTCMVLDRRLCFVAANASYLNTVGRTREELLGRFVFDAFPGDPNDPVQANVYELRASLHRVLAEKRPDVLPIIHYAIPASGGGFEDRYWSCVHSPTLDEQGEVDFILQNVVDVTELETLRRADPKDSVPASDMLRNVRTVQAENRILAAETSHLRQLFDQAPGFMAVLRGPDHVFEMINQAYLTLIGHRAVVGKTVREALPEIAGQGFFELLDGVYRTGVPYVGREMPALLQREPGAEMEQRYLDLIYAPNFAPDRTVAGIFVEGYDVTERVRGQDRQRLMLDELNHRVKNTLATVQSIASQTLRSNASPEEFAKAFEARLMSLSNAHNALTRGNWEGADLQEIISQELSPYGESRYALDGGAVKLSPRVALALGMVLHELATNAVKHGALSADAGRLGINWSTSADPHGEHTLCIVWRESDGPPVKPPTRKGFGSRLIDRSLTGELSGSAEMDFAPEGLICRINAPLRTEGAERGV